MYKELDPRNFQCLNFLHEFLEKHNGFIAGGCFKNIFNNEKVKDVDVFFRNIEDFTKAIIEFDNNTNDYYKLYENDNVVCYKHRTSNISVELIRKVFGTPKEILDKFDFTVTKFAVYNEMVEETNDKRELEEHIENKIICVDTFFEHLHMKRLVCDNEIQFPIGTFNRMIRYIRYGYYPCTETKMKIIMGIRNLNTSDKELTEIVIKAGLYEGWD